MMQCYTSPRTRFRRHYYTENQMFEQSLDVWEPLENLSKGGMDGSKKSKNLPVVVLVVGSGWLGHRSIIYAPTHWWNSSGPRTLARLGYVCVCVRHRGAFPVQLELRIILSILVSLVVAYIIFLAGSDKVWTATIAMTVFFLAWVVLIQAGRGSATFDDMLLDVADALVWVRDNKETTLGLGRRSSESRPLIFGGYSSGGHVAATLLQRPDLLASRGLPSEDMHQLCDGIIMVSGLLAVRPSNGSSSPSPADLLSDLPRWLTDMVLKGVFGREVASTIPSPLQGSSLPQLPHLLIGCKNETFGINWLDIFFCSRAFCKLLKSKGVPARFVEVPSNHWNILNSNEFARVLERELQWFSSLLIHKTND